MSGGARRSVEVERMSVGRYRAVNARGGEVTMGTGGEGDTDFTPVELLLAAIAGCSSVDVDLITSRRAEPEEFTVLASGEKASEPGKGNHMTDIEDTFRVRFPEGEGGDAAREAFPRSVAQSRDRLCTVSRTVQLGTPVQMSAEDL